MVWRFRNTGQTPWPGVELCCSDGDNFSYPGHNLSNLPAGQHIDVPVTLRAPNQNGSIGGAFRLRSELHGYITEPTWCMLEVVGARPDQDMGGPPELAFLEDAGFANVGAPEGYGDDENFNVGLEANEQEAMGMVDDDL